MEKKRTEKRKKSTGFTRAVSDEGHGNLWTEKGKEKGGQKVKGKLHEPLWDLLGFCREFTETDLGWVPK